MPPPKKGGRKDSKAARAQTNKAAKHANLGASHFPSPPPSHLSATFRIAASPLSCVLMRCAVV